MMQLVLPPIQALKVQAKHCQGAKAVITGLTLQIYVKKAGARVRREAVGPVKGSYNGTTRMNPLLLLRERCERTKSSNTSGAFQAPFSM